MAEQLIPLKHPSAAERAFEEDLDPSHLADTVGAAGPFGSRPGHAPLRAQPFQKRPLAARRLPVWDTVRPPLEMALFPLAAIGYLAFCYTVHGKVIPVNTYGLYAVTPEHLATIKGGITTITIIIISIALYPVYNTVSNLKSEEFFRVLASQNHGVPLETINHISTPSFGNVDKMVAIWSHRCSHYYVLGIVASLLIWIVGTLAPGALTVDNVYADGDLMAFAIGAIPAQSVLNGTYPEEPASNAGWNSDTAASIAWAEIGLGVQYSFGIADTSEPEYAAYVVPLPLDLSTETSARWLSDVIGINPMCSWASTNLTAPVQVPVNSTSDFQQYLATAYLLDFNLDVQIVGSDLPTDTPFATVKDPTSSVTNHTTQVIPSDGSMVFLLGQCQSGPGCIHRSQVDVTLDLTGLNTTFTIAFTDQTWSMATLVCKPNLTIETREVRSNGHGLLTVQSLPAGRQLTRQGNLNAIQTPPLFSIATKSLTQSAGVLTGKRQSYGLGSQVQGQVLFGKTQFDNLPLIDAPFGTLVTIGPAPIEDITQGYAQVLQSSAKSYLAGYLGTAYVPGRISETEPVFAASIPNLAVASAGFALLAALIVLAHFRPSKGVQFTLVNVAAAVYGSELPEKFVQMKAEQAAASDVYGDIDEEVEGDRETDRALGKGKSPHDRDNAPDDQQGMLTDRRIFMRRRADGSPVLHMS
ncbi:hypothetical protein L210DRAFT_3505600 [Boletus edulis BED1]|uniref:Uncharacterized protein n=1 Tax=Boletus edulis BED1 TaxID=1328754 RepID=A0AAD4BQM1_BOLED|nr:hypothetical protein L210DRAFT_3505600 [Boletus edulis BED1]